MSSAIFPIHIRAFVMLFVLITRGKQLKYRGNFLTDENIAAMFDRK